MIVTDDNISKGGDISYHEYGRNESKEEKIGKQSEVEEGSDDCGYEEGVDVEEGEEHPQE